MDSPKRARDVQPNSPNEQSEKTQKTQEKIGPRKAPTMPSDRPSRAHRIFEMVQRFWDGHGVNVAPAGSVRLRPSKFTKLLALLARNTEILEFAFRNLKFFYDRGRRKLTYAKPSPIHEEISGQLRMEISKQLWVIKSRSPGSEELLDLITYGMTCGIKMPGDEPHNDTTYVDGVWNFKTTKRKRPCFIVQVCFSQAMIDAVRKLRYIVFEKDGYPGMALIVKYQYASPKQLLDPPRNLRREASYTAFQWILDQNNEGKWENGVVRTIPRTEFRDKDGNVVPGKLSFSVRDFLGKEVCDRLPNSGDPALYLVLDQRISIDHSLMVKWVRDAEDTVRANAAGDSSSTDSEQDLGGHLGFYEDADQNDQEGVGSVATSTDTSFSAGLGGDTEYESPTPINSSDLITDMLSRRNAQGLHETALNNAASQSSESTFSASPGPASYIPSQHGAFLSRDDIPRESPDSLSAHSQEYRVELPVTPSKLKRTHSTSTNASDSSTDPLSTNNPEYFISPNSQSKRYRRWL